MRYSIHIYTDLDIGERSSTMATLWKFAQNTKNENKQRTLDYYTVFIKTPSYSCLMYASWRNCRFFYDAETDVIPSRNETSLSHSFEKLFIIISF